jgi:hypothetical protein
MIDNVSMDDLDCAHRVGEVKDHCQPMLVRCYSRDLIQSLLQSKSNLKGSEIMLHEDSTYLNRQLRLKLKDDPRVENSWLYHGAVWAKMVSNGKIAKFALDEDIYEKITKESAKIFSRPIKKPTQNRQNQRPMTPNNHFNNSNLQLPPNNHFNNSNHQLPRYPGPQTAYTSYYSPPTRYNPANDYSLGIPRNSFTDNMGTATSV